MATLDPNRALRVGATYQVVTRGLKDKRGDSLDANESWTFTVPDECTGCNPA